MRKDSHAKAPFIVNCALFFITAMMLFAACEDKWEKYEKTPDYLGASIYDYLQKAGNYTCYVRMIEDLDYATVLSKTGSKTLFVADDEAFARFFANNSWGVRRYEDLSSAQKKLILNSSMINNALLIEKLSTIEGPLDGQVLRRTTAIAVMDTLTFETGDKLPANHYWDRFRATGVRLAKDNTVVPMLHFSETQMRAKNITDEDFSILFNGIQRERDDAYIYNIRVKQRDIVCQNGYVHVLEDVLIPPSNAADVIKNIAATSMFSNLMERYAAPYYSESLTSQYKLVGGTDSVFVKGYFSERSGVVNYNSTQKTVIDPNGKTVTGCLLFDPGWNRYTASATASFQTDMAAIFAPSDAAMQRYFNEGSGKVLIDRYGSIDNIPDDVIDKLIRNHMKSSFLSTLPSQFGTIVDDAQEKMGIEKRHIDKVYLASNGVVYVTNEVYLPALYSSVMFPAVINENMRVFNWAIDQCEFDPYLLSMVNTYSFFLPTDNFTYIVPTTLKRDQPSAWVFHYNYNTNTVYAAVHAYDPATQQVGSDSIGVVTATATLKDHLEDMLDYHIIVGALEDGKEFYRTKGGGTVRIIQNGGVIQVAGGGEIERNEIVQVEGIYDQSKETNGRGNGKTYIIDQPLQTPTKSVYGVLSDSTNYPEFYEFFKLLQGYDDLWVGDAVRSVKFSIFYKDISQAGLDFNVRFLNTFHYTLYVPDNASVLQAIANGLPTWDDVEAETDQDKRDDLAERIIRFLRYHFQDNALFVDKPAFSASYETATLNNNTDTFYKLAVVGGNNALSVTSAKGETAHVQTGDGRLYNIMARDFKFNTANPATATTIETSSYIVIHLIDKCLYFE